MRPIARIFPIALFAPAMAWGLAACEGRGGGHDQDTTTDALEDDAAADGDSAGDTVDEDGAADALDDEAGDADLDSDVAEVPEEPDPEWERFLSERQGFLEDLSGPILYCIGQADTSNPAFHGCIDWHSAVEAAWALLALSRATGDPSYAAAADAVLTPAAIDAELAQLGTGGPVPTEIPYGYSWFLTLAVEREAGGDTDLVPLADVVSAELVTYVTGLTRSRIDGAIRANDYSNLSWNVLNVWQHAVYRGDDPLVTQMEDFTRNEILPREILCPLSRTPIDVDEFFAPCMLRARLLLTALPPTEAAAWAETGLPARLTLDPITAPGTGHPAGRHFSRSWNLLDLYEATGDVSFRRMYVEHIETHMTMTPYWSEGYDMYSHWIPQFGVYAIMRSY